MEYKDGYEGAAQLPPPIQTTDLVTDPAWLEACEKYGHHPLEFLTYGAIAAEARQQRLADEQEEIAHHAWIMEERKREYEMEADRLAAILAYDPKRFAKVLTTDHDHDCKDWCCNDFAA